MVICLLKINATQQQSLFFVLLFPSDAGFGTTGGFGSSAFGTTNNTGGLFGTTQNKPGMVFCHS